MRSLIISAKLWSQANPILQYSSPSVRPSVRFVCTFRREQGNDEIFNKTFLISSAATNSVVPTQRAMAHNSKDIARCGSNGIAANTTVYHSYGHAELSSPPAQQQCDAMRLKAFESMPSLLSPFSIVHGNSKWLTKSIRWIYINKKKYFVLKWISNNYADGQPIPMHTWVVELAKWFRFGASAASSALKHKRNFLKCKNK